MNAPALAPTVGRLEPGTVLVTLNGRVTPVTVTPAPWDTRGRWWHVQETNRPPVEVCMEWHPDTIADLLAFYLTSPASRGRAA